MTAALRSVGCSATGGEDHAGAINVRGVVGRTAESALRDALRSAAPDIAADWQVEVADGPYCGLLDALRPSVRPWNSNATSIAVALLDGRTTLVTGDLVVPRVVMPDFPAFLQLDSISNDGSVEHIHQATAGGIYPAGATPVFGRPDPRSPTYPVGDPYGTDLIIGVASSTPLFRAARPAEEKLDDFLRDLRVALDQAARNGTRVSATVILLKTSER